MGRGFYRYYENRNHDIQSNGELWLMERLRVFRPGLVIDGGANVGGFAKSIKECFPEAQLHCFEPVEETFATLQKNMEQFDHVTCHKKGLYSSKKRLTINLYSSSEHSSIYEIEGMHYEATGKASIDLIKGDDFVKKQKIEFVDFLKLDLEGAELDALGGFENLIRQKKVRLVQFEYGYINITTKNLLLNYYQFFKKHGYIVGKLYPREVDFREYSWQHEDFIGPNFVAIRDDDHELKKSLSR